MTIEIHQPEIQALIEQRMATGAFESIEDLLLQSLEASSSERKTPTEENEAPAQPPKQSLSQFLMASPLWKSGLVVERTKDLPRPVDL